MTIAEKPQGYTQLYKRHASAHMCTIENTEKLCKGTLEACSVVMVPSVMSCGRGAWVSTMRGGTQKKRTCRMPLALGSGAAPSARHTHRGRSWVHLGEPQSCAPSVPISVLKFHGTADPEFRWWECRRYSGYGRKSSLRLPRSSRDSHALGRIQQVCWRVETW